MSKQVISLAVGRQYLIERVGELRAQVPHGNPFVFLGAFSVLNVLGKVFDSSMYSLLENHFSPSEAEVISKGARLMFEGFTLTEEPSPYYNRSADLNFCIGGGGSVVEQLKKLNLSHKDREHLKAKNGRLTISAAAFLDDIETIINQAFESIGISGKAQDPSDPPIIPLVNTEVERAKVFVKLNETPLIGYGE